MPYAVTPLSPSAVCSFSMRAIDEENPLQPGEFLVDGILDGLNSSNSVWDPALVAVRSMTPTETAAIQATADAQVVGAQQTVQTLLNSLGVMTANGTLGPPYKALTAPQQTAFNVAMARSLIVLMKGSLT